MQKLKIVAVLGLFALLIYTRFVGLDWGLPFPMNPDERMMSNAVMEMTCNVKTLETYEDLKGCMNPEFFAYGQLPMYLAFILFKIWKLVRAFLGFGTELTFWYATMSLRIISASLSVVLSISVVKMYEYIYYAIYHKRVSIEKVLLALLIVIFQPYLIQSAHFGTTETPLMLIYIVIIYFCLRMLEHFSWRWVAAAGALVGIAAGIKTSGIIFGILPAMSVFYFHLYKKRDSTILDRIKYVSRYGLICLGFAAVMYVLSSPHNIISWNQFVQSMDYELAVGNGSLKVFYTTQFDHIIPYVFQFTHIFPYALGLPILIMSLCGMLLLSWSGRYSNFMRFSWFIYFLIIGTVFVKWSRFVAPILPIMTIFALLFLTYIYDYVREKKKNSLVLIWLLGIVVFMSLVPGIAYLHIYQTPDVRFQASEVIASIIPAGSKVFEEAGNVINIPVTPPGSTFVMPYYYFTAVDIYNLDEDQDMISTQDLLDQADVVIIPSRRIFASRTCLLPDDVRFSIGNILLFKDCDDLSKEYPYHQLYYSQLFNASESSEFVQVATISSYPKIEFFGKTLVEFPDEFAEETWTVFDHPVIRIYKRIGSL